MTSFLRFLENLQRKGCAVSRLSEGCAKLVKIAKSLVLEEHNNLHEAVRVSCPINMAKLGRIPAHHLLGPSFYELRLHHKLQGLLPRADDKFANA